MNLLRQLIAVVAAAAAMGSVQAQSDLGTLSPSVEERTGFATSGSFADVFNFSIGAEHNGFLGSSLGLAADGTPTVGTLSNLTLTLFAGSDATGPIQGSVTSANGSLIDLSGALAQGSYSLLISGKLADVALGGGYQLSVSANPEPAGWMLMLAGLMIVVFIARRKTSLVAG
jgi:hypothetical protein